jgi:DNA-directed RNA polymerase specialized sigma subunit
VAKPGEEGAVSQYFTVDQVREFKPILSFLNDKDRDILFLIFVSRKKQKDVQKILDRSQPSLCYDIKRIRRRLKFISYLYSVFDIFLNFLKVKREHFNSFELAVLTLMFYTSSFTQTSKIMRVSQVKVRYTYNKCLIRMKELRMWEFYEIFMVIHSNLNIIKRVYYGRGRTFLPLPL